MHLLHDDALLAVMLYLDVPALLACRLVCKRLRDLATHPHLWRHRKNEEWDKESCMCPVLRLAPCLDALYVKISSEGSCCQWSCTSTNCAVAGLHLSVDGDTRLATEIIARQKGLGRLKRVKLYVNSANVALLGLLASTSGLENLAITLVQRDKKKTPKAFVHNDVSVPSLRDFECSFCPSLESFVNFMLVGHAATLQYVKLSGHTLSIAPTATASLLARLPNLRELRCGCLPGLEAVAASETLRTLHLTIPNDPKFRSAAEGAKKLLQRAAHLRDVRLDYDPAASSVTDVGVDLVLALAASGRSRVEKLWIENSNNQDEAEVFPQLRSLLLALPSLSALRDLEVTDVQPDELLRALSITTTAPGLQHLGLCLPEEVCAHSWLHGHPVKTVMTARPSLHITFWPDTSDTLDCRRSSCEACVKGRVLGCHQGPEWDEEWVHNQYGLFSHDPVEKCSQSHDSDMWIHVPL